MATEHPESVSKIVVTQGRLDATVVLGATRYGVALDPRNPDADEVFAAVNTLRDALVGHAKRDLKRALGSTSRP